MKDPKSSFRDERLDILAGTRGDSEKRAVRLSEIPDLVADTAAKMIAAAMKLFTRTAAGLVPAPGGAGTTRFLREDATWVDPLAAASGLTRIDTQQPTTDVTAITFTGDVSTYKGIIVDFVGQISDNGASVNLQIRTAAGTWRTVAQSMATAGATSIIWARFECLNINNAEGSNIRRASVIGGRIIAALDRSDATQLANSNGGIPGHSSFTETINEVRLLLNGTGTIEGSTADQRAVATLYGVR